MSNGITTASGEAVEDEKGGKEGRGRMIVEDKWNRGRRGSKGGLTQQQEVHLEEEEDDEKEGHLCGKPLQLKYDIYINTLQTHF